ncbi:MAG: YceI family protein [Agarilytica sp.]
MKFIFKYLFCTQFSASRLWKQLAYMLLSVVFFVSTSGCASLLKPKLKQHLVDIKAGNYQLDPNHSTVLFKIDHMGFSKFIGRFNQFQARLTFDPEVIENSRLEAVVDMTSVDVNNEKFERALKGRFWFDSEHYPQAIFKTTSATKVGEGQLLFLGDLTFLGITEEIELHVKVNGAANNMISGKYTMGFSASASFSRSAFGLDRYVPTVGDLVELEIHAEFQQ